MDDSRKTKAQLVSELRELRQRVARLEAVPRTTEERDLAADRHALEDELLREASDLAKVGGWEFDALTLKGTWTAGVARIHDLDPAQETNVELGVSFYSTESRAKIEQAITAAIEHAQPYDLELEMVSAAGTPKWVRTIGLPTIKDGRVIRVRGIFQDITERRRNQDALLASEAKYRALFNNFMAGMALHQMVYNAQGEPVDYVITEVNPLFETLLGLKRDLVVGRLATLAYRVEAAPYLDVYARVAQTGEPARFETYFAPLDQHFDISVISPGPGQFATIFVDVSLQKRAQAALNNLAKFPEENPHPVMRFRPDGLLLYSNTAGQPLLQTWECAVGDVAPVFWRQLVVDVYAAGSKRAIEVDNGDRVWSFFLTPIVDGGYVNLYGSDITARKRMEEEITALNADLERRVAERTAELSDLYDNAPCGYHSVDVDGTFVRVNQTELNWLGYTREEMVGRLKFSDLLTPASVPMFQENFPVFKERGWVHDLEFELVRKDGSLLPVLLSATTVCDEAGHYLMSRSTIVDHTERKQAEEAMRLSQLRLEAANKELEAFSYSISHDLRAPLRSLDGFSRILLEDYAPQLSADAQHYLQIVRKNSQTMGRLIDDLLAFSRLGRQPLRKQPVDLTTLVRQTLTDLLAETGGRSIELVVADLPPCEADPALLKQVLINLLSNAIKFTSKRPRAQIEIGCIAGQHAPVYFVKDNGAGFDLQYADKLFGVFQRLHRAEDYEGTGVGLAIVRRVIERHGGHIWAESAIDDGATFYFTLSK